MTHIFIYTYVYMYVFTYYIKINKIILWTCYRVLLIFILQLHVIIRL